MVDITIGKALVMLGVMLIIGVYVFSTIGNSINRAPLSAAANTSITNVETNVYNAFTLAGVAAIVVGAAFIMRNLAF